MAEVGDAGNEDGDELLEQIFEDEVTANAGDETDAQRDGRRLMN